MESSSDDPLTGTSDQDYGCARTIYSGPNLSSTSVPVEKVSKQVRVVIAFSELAEITVTLSIPFAAVSLSLLSVIASSLLHTVTIV